MAAYGTYTLPVGFSIYTHNASAASTFETTPGFYRYPNISKIIAVNPSNPNSVGIWSPGGFNPSWLTGFQPGSAYQVTVETAPVNVIQEGDYPGVSVRTITGPFAYLSIPLNSVQVPLSSATVTVNSVVSALTAVISNSIWTPRIDSATVEANNNSWLSFDPKVGIPPFVVTNSFTHLRPGSAYYVDIGSTTSFVLNIPRRNSYLITNENPPSYIITNSGDYIVVQQGL